MNVPYSEDAEEAVIGMMMLSRPALEETLDVLSADDFYKPAHRQVFTACRSLYHQGKTVDPGLVALELRGAVERGELLRIQGSAPPSVSVEHYAGKLAELGAARRTITLSEELSKAGYSADLAKVDSLLVGAADGLRREQAEPAIEASELAAMDFPRRWAVEGLLERLEVALFIGRSGFGKSTLMRQISVCLASGMHPFTRTPIPALRVLIVDCENTWPAVQRSIRGLLALSGDRYRRLLWLQCRPQGIDLTQRRDARWLEALCARHKPDVLVTGPLYKMCRGAPGRLKNSEETAEIVTQVIDEVKVRYDLAVLIEAHKPHGDEYRVRGSAVWENWPAFSFGLVPDETYAGGRAVDIDRSSTRGDREAGRAWPDRLVQGPIWPWEPVEQQRFEEVA